MSDLKLQDIVHKIRPIETVEGSQYLLLKMLGEKIRHDCSLNDADAPNTWTQDRRRERMIALADDLIQQASEIVNATFENTQARRR